MWAQKFRRSGAKRSVCQFHEPARDIVVVELLKDTEWDDSTPELRAERAQEYLQAFDVSTERAPAHSHSRLWLCALTPSPQRPPSLYLPPALTGNVPTYPA